MKAVKSKTTEKSGYAITSSATVDGTKFVPAYTVKVDYSGSDTRTIERLIKDLEKHVERIEEGSRKK